MTRAVFYDVDGTLVASTVVHPLAWYAAHQALPSRSVVKTAALLTRIPLYWALDQVSRSLFNTLFYKEYRGMSRNRLATLAEEMFATTLLPRIYPAVGNLIADFRKQGVVQVLITGALDFTVAPLARHFNIEHVIANCLVFQDGVATGAVVAPLVAEETKVIAMRQFAEAHRIDLSDSFAYADSHADLPMLKGVGHPTAVRPDKRLKQAALANRWPVVEWHAI